MFPTSLILVSYTYHVQTTFRIFFNFFIIFLQQNITFLVLSKIKKSYFSRFFRCSTETHSTCSVCGNISTTLTSTSLYLSSSCISLTKVIGSHDTYIIFLILALFIISLVCLSSPALGGSTIKISPSIFLSIILDTSLHIKLALSILFIFLL